MRKLLLGAALVALATPAFAAGTWHTYIPRSKFHPMVGSSCTAAQMSGGGGIASYNKDVLDCPAANAQAFFGIEYWYPANTAGNTLGIKLFGETDQAENGVWCNIVSYLVSPPGANSHWSSNDGQLGATPAINGAPFLSGGGDRMAVWPANGSVSVTAHIQGGADCSNATPSDCAGSPGIIFIRRGITGTDSCGAGTDIGHTVHYIGADISGTWP